jgi:dTDP-4-dehydrorhamnose 3,5-epimerase/reductase
MHLRTESATFGKVETFELDQSQALYLPKGVGNSFQALTDDVAYVYLVTGLYDKDKAFSGGYIAINYSDPDLEIPWPIAEAIVSDKDQKNPTLREAFPEKF